MTTQNNIVITNSNDSAIEPFFERALANVRDDIADNPYIKETIKVLTVGGHRSAIGCFWNAVVDDLRNKIIYRSLALFNKSIETGREVKVYEDFQNFINDDQLIEGAYKIGVIGWEASKVLKHAKETRHIFDGHPKSSDPSILRVLAMFDDCVKYVLNEPYPAQIVDIDEYITTMDSSNFDRNEFAVANALTELPEIYKNELGNRLFTVCVHPNTSSILRSSVEFVSPILWRVLPKETKIQLVRRVDQQITKSDISQTNNAFSFVNIIGANAYLSATARNYLISPLVIKLKNSLDVWPIENECVKGLEPYAANIPKMFQVFDDNAANSFVETIKQSEVLRRRIESPAKLERLRSLANIVLERISSSFGEKDFLKNLVDQSKAGEFFKQLQT